MDFVKVQFDQQVRQVLVVARRLHSGIHVFDVHRLGKHVLNHEQVCVRVLFRVAHDLLSRLTYRVCTGLVCL